MATLIEPSLIDELEKVSNKVAATSFSAEQMQDSLANWRDLRQTALDKQSELTVQSVDAEFYDVDMAGITVQDGKINLSSILASL